MRCLPYTRRASCGRSARGGTAGQAEAKAERDIPPPNHPKTTLDLAQLQQQADELAKLAQTVPLDVASIKNGMLPKDPLQKLKQIEKLSKRLHNELDR